MQCRKVFCRHYIAIYCVITLIISPCITCASDCVLLVIKVTMTHCIPGSTKKEFKKCIKNTNVFVSRILGIFSRLGDEILEFFWDED